MPGGVFVTTTLMHDWTDELKEFYICDARDEAHAAQLWGEEIAALVSERVAIVRRPNTLATLLVWRT